MSRSRRTLLATATGTLSLASAGCLGALGSTTPDPPDVDCEDASRPTWSRPEDPEEDAEAPPAYPSGPPPTDETDAIEYAVTFERAYSHNAAGQREGDDLLSFHLGNVRTETLDAPPNSVTCRLEYDTSYRVSGAENDLVGEGTGTASYYLDATTVVRGESSWQTGEPVGCFQNGE